MALLDWLLPRRSKLATKTGSWTTYSETPGVLWRSNESTSGATVDLENSLYLSAVFAGVNLYSLVLSSLPLIVYRSKGGTREVANDHPAYKLLHTTPNPEMTAVTFRRVLEWHRLLGGAAYAEIEWDELGNPVALWPLESWRVQPARTTDTCELYYRVDGTYEVAAEDMLYIPLVSFDGVCGRSFIDFAIESLGLGITAQQFAGEFYGNGTRPNGLLKHAGNTSPEARKQIREAWEKRHKPGGVLGMLWGGWEYDATAGGESDMEKAQLLESRRFSTEEVARWLNIPPHLLRDLSRATFSNIEAQQRDALTYSFGPVLIHYEQEYDRRLLTPKGYNPGAYYSKHKVEGFLRADSGARSAFYREMLGQGVYTINTVLELEDMNPIGPLGDMRFVPLNMQTLDQAAKPPEPPPPPAPPAPAPEPKPEPKPEPPKPEEPKDDPTLRAWLTDTLERLMRVEVNAALRAVKDPGKFLAWIDEHYPPFVRKVDDALRVPLNGKPYKGRWVRDSIESLMDLSGRATAKTLQAEAETLFKQWDARPAQEAARIMEALRCRE
jgi:HK97 family phage portal protein